MQIHDLHSPAGRADRHLPESISFCRTYGADPPGITEDAGGIGLSARSSLTYVRIPSGVRYIGEQAFSGCDRMKILEIDHDPDFLGEHIVNHSTVIRCRKGSAVDAYCREYGYQTEYL